MEHFIFHAVLGRTPRVSITKAEYDAIEKSWNYLTSLLAIEEEFDALLQNYFEFERGFLEEAMREMVFQLTDLVELRKTRLKFARLLSNLLSSSRSYLDHTPHMLNELDPELVGTFKELRNRAYDREFAYRLMEALRNYAQHRGSPLHGTTFGTKRVARGNDEFGHQYSVWASINPEKLTADKKFSRRVANELSDYERIDIVYMVRVYLEKLGEIHTGLRDAVKILTSNSITLLRNTVQDYDLETGEGTTGISYGRSENGDTIESYRNIPLDVIDLFNSLVSQNRSVVNLRRRFVSNEILPDRTPGK